MNKAKNLLLKEITVKDDKESIQITNLPFFLTYNVDDLHYSNKKY